jgi:putative transcriptional regulator
MTYNCLVRFEWDQDKDRINQQKHGIGFKEAIGRADHQCSVGYQEGNHSVPDVHGGEVMSDIPELDKEDFKKAIKRSQRARIIKGKIESGKDVVALRRFVDMSQSEFSRALGVSVHTLRNREQGRRKPQGPALALLRIAARHPRILQENLAVA